jgi:subtilisin family serine protease
MRGERAGSGRINSPKKKRLTRKGSKDNKEVPAPNDPDFRKLWGLNHIHAKDAWQKVRESSVIVGILDTGIDPTHEDLAGNLWLGPQREFGLSTVPPGLKPIDDHKAGHGTHCAGIIGAVGNNGKGGVGVAWKVKLMALKCLDSNGVGYADQVVRCIDFAVANKAMVLNSSWVTRKYSKILDQAITRAQKAGILLVAAAGNVGNDNDKKAFYPGCYSHPNIITVLATDGRDAKIPNSNFGKRTVHLGAPGDTIFSCKARGGYSYQSGTSQAAAFVSGAAALTWSHPKYAKAAWQQVKAALLQNAHGSRLLLGQCRTDSVLDIGFLR